MPPITYSPSWTFIPTHFCRNTCGYCLFVERTGARAGLASLETARSEIERAHQAGATELLIMSGEGVETSAHIRRALDEQGVASYIDYLIHVALLALARDILPHINIGNIGEDEIRRLRLVVPSMGMMLESVDDSLRSSVAHRCATDKSPARRLETLRAAGRARMPWTTGILVGIGETHLSRRRTLEAIAGIHDEHQHIQEVIVQPFTAHEGTAMKTFAQPSVELLRDTVRLAREILPGEVAVQIPPNIATEVLTFISAGARDLGGISPDGDRINPNEKWLVPIIYAARLRPHGYTLEPRLAVHDTWISPHWLAPETLLATTRVRPRLPHSSEDAHEAATMTATATNFIRHV